MNARLVMAGAFYFLGRRDWSFDVGRSVPLCGIRCFPQYVAPDGASEIFFGGIWCYKYAAPTALDWSPGALAVPIRVSSVAGLHSVNSVHSVGFLRRLNPASSQGSRLLENMAESEEFPAWKRRLATANIED
jgi:hypothetical protein